MTLIVQLSILILVVVVIFTIGVLTGYDATTKDEIVVMQIRDDVKKHIINKEK